jgi:hypothetical protein
MSRISSNWLTPCSSCKGLGLKLYRSDGSDWIRLFRVLDFCDCKHGQYLRQHFPHFERIYDPHIFWSEELKKNDDCYRW